MKCGNPSAKSSYPGNRANRKRLSSRDAGRSKYIYIIHFTDIRTVTGKYKRNETYQAIEATTTHINI